MISQKSKNTDHLRFLVDTINEVVWEAASSGKVTYVNKKWYDYTGCSISDDITDVWLHAVHPDDIDVCTSAWLLSIKTGEPYEIEYRFREGLTGKYNWFLSRAMPHRNERGEIVQWYGTCTNIQTQKEHARLMEMNRAKDEFISIASHQLRTPATAVKQYIGMTLEGLAGSLNPQQYMMIEKANENNERQLRIVSDLLRVARVEVGSMKVQKEEIDIRLLVQQAMNDQTDAFTLRKQNVNFVMPQSPIRVDADVDILMMVLDNIIDNASKYTPEGEAICIKIHDKEKNITIDIIDEGVGIDSKDVQHLFKKFSRINNRLSTKVGGTGLGLYWAKKVMRRHGGRILYQKNYPRGSIFSIVIEK